MCMKLWWKCGRQYEKEREIMKNIETCFFVANKWHLAIGN